MEIDESFIYESIKDRYTNPIIKDLPKIITTYILNNPSTHKTFLDNKIKIKSLLKYLKDNLCLSNPSSKEIIIKTLSYINSLNPKPQEPKPTFIQESLF